MGQLLPSALNCCNPCPAPTTTNIPGVQGDDGADGTNGADGANAYTTLTAPFVMPDYNGFAGDEGNATVADTSWMVVGQKVFIGKASSAAKGTFEVVAVVDGTTVTLLNVADGVTAYTENSVPGTIFPAASGVSPAGLQGPAGANGTSGAPDDATYLLRTADANLASATDLSALATGLIQSTTGTGAIAIVPIGIANDNALTVDQVAGLTNGDVVFATTSGLETKTDVNALAALGIVLGVTDDDVVTVDDAAGLTAGEPILATAAGIQSVTPATFLAAVGISATIGAYLLYQHQEATTVESGSWTSGAWRTVPLNTEVVDTGSDGSLAGNIVTLKQGTYRARWRVIGFNVDKFQSRLYNVDTGAIQYGSNAKADVTIGDSTAGESCGEGRFTIAAATERVRIEGWCETTNVTNGFGPANSFGGTEVYASLELQKEV